jgi:DNA repair exonuclease SbcCD nuclease subunit
MRFAVLADAHIGRTIPLSVAQYRVEAFSRAFSKAVDAIIEAGADYVFFCGDLFERRTLRPHLVVFVHDELYRLAREIQSQHGKEVKIFLIRGNHDGRSTSNTLDYIKHPLAQYLVVFDEERRSYSEDGLTIIGVGYYDQADRIFEEIVKPAFDEAKGGMKILMLHAFVKGHHDVPPNTPALTVDELSEVPASFIFSGHYHKRCKPVKLRSGAWLLTPGSLELYDFGEEPPKGFWLVDVDAGSEPQFRWVEIEPMHLMRKLEISGKGRNPPSWYQEKVLESVKAFQNELRRTNKSGYLRVVVSGELSEGFPSDIDLSGVEAMRKDDPRLLYVDVDTMELEVPHLGFTFERERIDIAEFFRDFGDFASEISEMHAKVRETLEESASVQTGLLPPSQRVPLIEEWLRRFRERMFGGEAR